MHRLVRLEWLEILIRWSSQEEVQAVWAALVALAVELLAAVAVVDEDVMGPLEANQLQADAMQSTLSDDASLQQALCVTLRCQEVGCR